MAVKKILSKTTKSLSFVDFEQDVQDLFDWIHTNDYEFKSLSIAVNQNLYVAVITYEDKV